MSPLPAARRAAPVNRIGGLEFRLDVDEASRQLGTPEKLLMAVRAELLDVIDTTLAETARRHGDVAVERIEIDLGDFPDPPDWTQVRARLRERLLGELAPHAGLPVVPDHDTTARTGADSPDTLPPTSGDPRNTLPPAAGDDLRDAAARSSDPLAVVPRRSAPTARDGRARDHAPDPGDDARDAPRTLADLVIGVPHMSAMPANPAEPGHVPSGGARGGEANRDAVPVRDTTHDAHAGLGDPGIADALITQLRWRRAHAASRLRHDLQRLTAAELRQLLDLLDISDAPAGPGSDSDERATRFAGSLEAEPTLDALVGLIEQWLDEPAQPAIAPADIADIAGRLRAFLPDDSQTAPDAARLSAAAERMLRMVAPSRPLPATPQGKPDAASDPEPRPAYRDTALPQLTDAGVRQRIAELLPDGAMDLAGAIAGLDRTAENPAAARRLVLQALERGEPVDLEKARAATPAREGGTGAVAALLRAFRLRDREISAFLDRPGSAGRAAASRTEDGAAPGATDRSGLRTSRKATAPGMAEPPEADPPVRPEAGARAPHPDAPVVDDAAAQAAPARMKTRDSAGARRTRPHAGTGQDRATGTAAAPGSDPEMAQRAEPLRDGAPGPGEERPGATRADPPPGSGRAGAGSEGLHHDAGPNEQPEPPQSSPSRAVGTDAGAETPTDAGARTRNTGPDARAGGAQTDEGTARDTEAKPPPAGDESAPLVPRQAITGSEGARTPDDRTEDGPATAEVFGSRRNRSDPRVLPRHGSADGDHGTDPDGQAAPSSRLTASGDTASAGRSRDDPSRTAPNRADPAGNPQYPSGESAMGRQDDDVPARHSHTDGPGASSSRPKAADEEIFTPRPSDAPASPESGAVETTGGPGAPPARPGSGETGHGEPDRGPAPDDRRARTAPRHPPRPGARTGDGNGAAQSAREDLPTPEAPGDERAGPVTPGPDLPPGARREHPADDADAGTAPAGVASPGRSSTRRPAAGADPGQEPDAPGTPDRRMTQQAPDGVPHDPPIMGAQRHGRDGAEGVPSAGRSPAEDRTEGATAGPPDDRPPHPQTGRPEAPPAQSSGNAEVAPSRSRAPGDAGPSDRPAGIADDQGRTPQQMLSRLFDAAAGPEALELRDALGLIWRAMPFGMPGVPGDAARYWHAALAAALTGAGGTAPRIGAFDAFFAAAIPDEATRLSALRLVIARLSYDIPGTDAALRHATRLALDHLFDRQAPEAQAATPEVPQDYVITERAGLVLFHPYLPMLFERLELLADRRTLAPAALPRAAAALAALGEETPGTRPPEPLERLLLALPAGQEITAAALADRERELIESLIRSVIAQWSRLGQTSPAGLRAAFVRRTGVLNTEAAAPKLLVDEGPYDMLLDSLPWSLSPVALPWMPAPLNVIWRTRDD